MTDDDRVALEKAAAEAAEAALEAGLKGEALERAAADAAEAALEAKKAKKGREASWEARGYGEMRFKGRLMSWAEFEAEMVAVHREQVRQTREGPSEERLRKVREWAAGGQFVPVVGEGRTYHVSQGGVSEYLDGGGPPRTVSVAEMEENLRAAGLAGSLQEVGLLRQLGVIA
jgi:hypothetical protein